MRFDLESLRWLSGAGALLLIVSSAPTLAHRSGCHRWHSCPPDLGTYVCGDTGHCSQCADNEYCKLSKPRRESQENAPPPPNQDRQNPGRDRSIISPDCEPVATRRAPVGGSRRASADTAPYPRESPTKRRSTGSRSRPCTTSAYVTSSRNRRRSTSERALRSWSARRRYFGMSSRVISPTSLNRLPSTTFTKITAAVLSPFASHSTGRV
jgi:hypothetical protein